MNMHSPATLSDISPVRASRKALIIIIILSMIGTVDCDVINVCYEGCEYNSIVMGIKHAKPGDIVEVRSGTYRENLVVKTPIILRGVDSGDGMPEVDADYNGSGFTIATDGVSIDGFKIHNSRGRFFDLWAGINLNSNNNIIINNTIFDNKAGILLSGSGNNTIVGNTVSGNTYGIRVDGGLKNNVSRNNACGNEYDGIRLDGSQSNYVKENYLCRNLFGLRLLASRNNSVFGNEIINNDYGIFLNSSNGNILRNNKINGNNCSFDAARDNNVDTSNLVDNKPIYFLMHASDMEIDSSSNAGLVYCFDCKNVTIEGQTMKDNLYGIYFCNTTQSIIKENALKNNTYGIKLDASEENIIANNNIGRSLMDGISLNASKNNFIESNLLNENEGSGLDMVYSIENKITDNIAADNYNGLTLSWSHENKIIDNNFSLNRNFGVSLVRSGYNNISSNKLNENFFGAALESSWNNDIISNTIHRNEKGLQILASHDNNISNNIISENRIILSRDLLPPLDYIIKNRILKNEKYEEIIPPFPTTSLPGYIPIIKEIDISSNPNNAEILIDKNPKGKTNQTIKILEGEHELELSWRNSSYPYIESFNTTRTKIFVDRQEWKSE